MLIGLFNQLNLPGAFPTFDPALHLRRLCHRLEPFEPDQRVTLVVAGKVRADIALMFTDAKRQIGSRPGINRPILTIDHDVGGDEVEACHYSPCVTDHSGDGLHGQAVQNDRLDPHRPKKSILPPSGSDYTSAR